MHFAGQPEVVRSRVNARVSVARLFWEGLGAAAVGTGGTLVQRSHPLWLSSASLYSRP